MLSEIITAICGLITGGGVMSIFLFKQKREKEDISNTQEIIKIYKDIINEYRALLCFNKGCSNRINANASEQIKDN